MASLQSETLYISDRVGPSTTHNSQDKRHHENGELKIPERAERRPPFSTKHELVKPNTTYMSNLFLRLGESAQ